MGERSLHTREVAGSKPAAPSFGITCKGGPVGGRLGDYEARISLSDDGEQTAIHWRSEFHPKILATGRLIRGKLAQVIADAAERAAREAERVADDPSAEPVPSRSGRRMAVVASMQCQQRERT